MHNDIAGANHMILQTEKLEETAIPETEILPEVPLNCVAQAYQEAQLAQSFQETQLVHFEPGNTGEERGCAVEVPELSQAQPSLAEDTPKSPHNERPATEEAAEAQLSLEQNQQDMTAQPAMDETLGTAVIHQRRVEQPIKEIKLGSSLSDQVDSEKSLALPSSSPAAAIRAEIETCGAPALAKLAVKHLAEHEQDIASEGRLLGGGEAVLPSNNKAGLKEDQPDRQGKTPDLFNLEAVQFTAAAATQGETFSDKFCPQ